MRCQRPWCLCLLLLSVLIPTLLHAQQFCAYRMRTHATDCTVLTDGDACDLCYELDQSRLFSCVPTVAGEACSGSEWKEIKFVVTDADVPNGITITLAATATALATNPTPCPAGQYVSDLAADGTLTCGTPTGGAGDVSGPASATPDALARYDDATGKVLQGSTATLTDAGILTATSYETAADPDHGGLLRLCEDGDLDPVNDCVVLRVPNALNLPDGDTIHDVLASGKLPNTLIENLPPFTSADPGATNILAYWDDTTNKVTWESVAAHQTRLGIAATVVKSVYWPAGSLSTDGTNCATPTEVTINSGPKQYTIVCLDNDASRIYGRVMMPDSWNAGTVTFKVSYVQTAANTSALNMDVACQARGPGETINATYGTEVAIDDTNVTGSNAVDHTTSGPVTCNCTTSCQAGDSLAWYLDIDATGTTTAMATLHILGVLMEYTGVPSD